jgi:hypothetical protein
MKRPSVLYGFLDQACASRKHEDDVHHLIGPQFLLKEAEQPKIIRVVLKQADGVGYCNFLAPQSTLALDIISHKNSSICAETHHSSSPSQGHIPVVRLDIQMLELHWVYEGFVIERYWESQVRVFRY